MPALSVDDLALDPRQLVERHVNESFSDHRTTPFDGTRRISQYSARNHDSVASRVSSDLASSRLSSFGFIPGHEVIETSVRFLGVTRVATHCEFKLHVDTVKEKFVLRKRFSQFRDLRLQLLLDSKATTSSTSEKGRRDECRNGACVQLAHQLSALKFPRRKMKFKMHRDDDIKIARERQAQLQQFVELILAVYRTASKRQVRCCVNSQCRVLKAIQSFLDIKDLGDDVSDWKMVCNGTTSGDEVPILDTPPSTSSNPSPLSKTAFEAATSNESPIRRKTSIMYLEELYTITEDT
ncbi:hypothetical protein GN244_ATG07204 [Phytophthora infestans]|uniref:PX domain-containing protein n=1 Tax=Phytophthora infestans TaxID=4787 RepID=A0A833T6E8_PHYIN|nr:hypothetical protein GN244_ATG07204 [Phytophthora infestans]KAF4135777.1 hypothetical protein GN958_ATG15001 [Phytophthora infestans]